jgi:hypothetical protein
MMATETPQRSLPTHARLPRCHRCPPLCADGARRNERSPWCRPFPPNSPPTISRLCSNPSRVLWPTPTPPPRTHGSYGMWPSPSVHRVGARISVFRGSMAGPPVPLSTLHPRRRRRQRMTRGQRGSLLLHCGAPSSPTLRRFIPALSDSLRRQRQACYQRAWLRALLASNGYLTDPSTPSCRRLPCRRSWSQSVPPSSQVNHPCEPTST